MRQGGLVLTQSLGNRIGFDAKCKVRYMSREDGDLSAILKEFKDWRTSERKLIIIGCFMDRNSRKSYSGNLDRHFGNLLCGMEVSDKFRTS